MRVVSSTSSLCTILLARFIAAAALHHAGTLIHARGSLRASAGSAARTIPKGPGPMSALFTSPPAALLARPPVFIPRPTTPLEELPPGSAGGPGAGRLFPRKFNEQPKNVPCTYCGRPTTDEPESNKLNGDHVIPRSQGGNDDPSNYAPSCRTCNLKKGPITPTQWYEQMRVQDLNS